MQKIQRSNQNGRKKKQTPNERTQNSPEEPYEMEASNLSDREFRVMIIRILNGVKKDTETIRKDQSEIKNAISEKNNPPKGINSRSDGAEDRISVLEDKVEKTNQAEQKRKEF